MARNTVGSPGLLHVQKGPAVPAGSVWGDPFLHVKLDFFFFFYLHNNVTYKSNVRTIK